MKNTSLLAGMLMIALTVGCQGQTTKSTSSAPQGAPAKTVASDKPVMITKDDFIKLVMDYRNNPDKWQYAGQKPCLVDFYADWCAPCRITGPILEDLSKEYAGKINFYKVNIDQEQELASLFNVQSIPTFLFCPMTGNPTISSGIANTPEATKAMFRDQINKLLLSQNGPSSSL